VPYGTKSPDTVIRYARACADILLDRGVKMIVVACNTASAFALDNLRDTLEIPVLGVVEPGSEAAVERTRNRRVGVIGTSGTIASGQYVDTIRSMDESVEIFCRACPLFVPLAEEGWTEGELPRLAAHAYLSDLTLQNIDTLVLGCTHYPLLKEVIGEVMGPDVSLVDSAEATAQAVAAVLDAMDAKARPGAPVSHRFLVSDAPESFARVGKRFLGCNIDDVEWVDF
jgi:glutamate racemase